MKIESSELIRTLRQWQADVDIHTGLKEFATYQKVIDEIKRMETNEEIKQRIEKERRESCKRKNVDTGKIKALRTAKWSVQKIADEMDVTPQTVRYHLDRMGLK